MAASRPAGESAAKRPEPLGGALKELAKAFGTDAAEYPLREGTGDAVEPLVLDVERDGAKVSVTLWLHHRLKTTCWYFKALYEYEAFVTDGPDVNSPRYAVDRLDLHIRHDVDHANYTHSCTSTDYCAKSDEVTATFGACGKSCLNATATIWGQSWSTTTQCLE